MKKRLAAHNSGQGAKYTRSRHPVELIYYETYETKEAAMKWEAEIKKLSHKEKLSLIQSFNKPII